MTKRSLILVTVDCLRADHVGFMGYPRPVTPFLDSLSETATVFSNAIVAGTPTYFSFPVMMASRYPLDLGRDVLGIAPGESTIATILRESGYETGAFIAGNPYLTPRFGYDQGFTKFQDFMNQPPKRPELPQSRTGSGSKLNRQIERLSRATRITAAAYNELYFRYCQWSSSRGILSMDQLRRYPAADVVVDQAISWVKALQDQRFFLWIHLMDPHHPYYPPQEALTSLGVSSRSAQQALFLNSFWNRGDLGPNRLRRHRNDIVDLYDAGVHWVDRQLMRLVNALKQQQLWDQSVFVVTADHGEEFLEHGNRYHSPVGLPEQLIRVPLLIHSPDVSKARTLTGLFSMIHLAPTLLESLGMEIPPSFQGNAYWGQVLSGEIPENPVITECVGHCNNPLSIRERLQPRLLAVRDRDYKLVIRFENNSESFYSLKADPLEARSLPADVGTIDRLRLWRLAGRHLRESRARRDSRLALRAKFREIRQQLSLRGEADAKQIQGPVEIAGHG